MSAPIQASILTRPSNRYSLISNSPAITAFSFSLSFAESRRGSSASRHGLTSVQFSRISEVGRQVCCLRCRACAHDCTYCASSETGPVLSCSSLFALHELSFGLNGCDSSQPSAWKLERNWCSLRLWVSKATREMQMWLKEKLYLLRSRRECEIRGLGFWRSSSWQRRKLLCNHANHAHRNSSRPVSAPREFPNCVPKSQYFAQIEHKPANCRAGIQFC